MLEAQTLPRGTIVPNQVQEFPYRERSASEPSHTYKVPADAHWIYIEASGGSGGYTTGGESGGPGGASIIAALVPVVPNDTLSLFIGDGSFRGYQGMPGYRPGGNGGTASPDLSSNGGGGGGSTAVVDSKGQVLLHVAGGGGSGGRGGLFGEIRGGNGGTAGFDPGNGANGASGPTSPGGAGGKGGDTQRTDRGGPGSHATFGGGGGGGGGGSFCGDGGGGGAGPFHGGGGGGGGGASDIIGSAIGIKESSKSPTKGHIIFSRPSFITSTVASSAFKDVFLRMDGKSVTEQNPIGGTVNCQYTVAGHFEHFYVRPQKDGTVAIEAEEFPDVYLRMDGIGLSPQKIGTGVVNCRYGTDRTTYFRIVAHPDRLAAIESVAFPGVFLGIDGNGVNKVMPEGGGRVYCRFGAESWEVFRLLA